MGDLWDPDKIAKSVWDGDYFNRSKPADEDVSDLLDRMRGGVFEQESGGNYQVKPNRRTRATGGFQVMPDNIPGWTEKHYGRRLTREEFERDPDAQESVFAGEMGKYLRKARAKAPDDDTAIRMAAAAWYGGEDDMDSYDNPRRFRPDEPSFREYTSSVLKKSAPRFDANEIAKGIWSQQPTPTAATPVFDPNAIANNLWEVEVTPKPATDTQAIDSQINELSAIGEAARQGVRYQPPSAEGATKATPPPPTQETPETISSQALSALNAESPRAAVLLTEPNQEKLLDPAMLKAFSRVETPHGTLLVNEAKAKALGVTDYQKDLAKLIGKIDDVGTNTATGPTVLTTDPQGNELAASRVTSPKSAIEQAALDAQSFLGGTNSQIVDAQDVVQKRQVDNGEKTGHPLIDTLTSIGEASKQGEKYQEPESTEMPQTDQAQDNKAAYNDYLAYATKEKMKPMSFAEFEAKIGPADKESSAASAARAVPAKPSSEQMQALQQKFPDKSNKAKKDDPTKPFSFGLTATDIVDPGVPDEDVPTEQKQQTQVGLGTATIDPTWTDEEKIRHAANEILPQYDVKPEEIEDWIADAKQRGTLATGDKTSTTASIFPNMLEQIRAKRVENRAQEIAQTRTPQEKFDPAGTTWQKVKGLTPEEIRQENLESDPLYLEAKQNAPDDVEAEYLRLQSNEKLKARESEGNAESYGMGDTGTNVLSKFYSGAAGTADFGAGILHAINSIPNVTLIGDPNNEHFTQWAEKKLRSHANQLRAPGEKFDKEHPDQGMAQQLLGMAASATSDVPRILALPGGAAVAFGTDALLRDVGHKGHVDTDTIKQTGIALATGALFHGAGVFGENAKAGLLKSVLPERAIEALATGRVSLPKTTKLLLHAYGRGASLGVITSGTAGMALAEGHDPKTAFNEAVKMGLFDIAFNAKRDISALSGKVIRAVDGDRISNVTVTPKGEVVELKRPPATPDIELDVREVAKSSKPNEISKPSASLDEKPNIPTPEVAKTEARVTDTRTEPKNEVPEPAGEIQEPVAPKTVTHPNPVIDGKEIIAETADGKVVVPNPDNKSGVSVVMDHSELPKDFEIVDSETRGIGVARLKELRDVARREAETDTLTGLANRSALDKALPSAEKDADTSVLAFDANNFGKINKEVGQAEGDRALVDIGNAIKQAADENGVTRTFRRGGDEFVVLAPKGVADKIRARAEEIYGDKKYGETNVSLTGTVGGTFAEADSALQSAKTARKQNAAIPITQGADVERSTGDNTASRSGSTGKADTESSGQTRQANRGLTNADIATGLNRFTKAGDLHKYARRIKDYTREEKVRVVENLRAGDDPVSAIKDAKGFTEPESLGDPGAPRSPSSARFENNYKSRPMPDPHGREHENLADQEAHARALVEVRMPMEAEAREGFEKSNISHADVTQAYEKVLDNLGRTTPIRTGHIAERGARGIYKPQAEVIRLREAGNVPTAAHEIFHGVQKVMFGATHSGALKRVPRQAIRELVQMGKDLYGDTKPAGGYATEGFAEFGRYYLTHEIAKQKAPVMYKYFTEEFLPNHPELAKGLDSAREITDAYRNQGAKNRATANMSKSTILGRTKEIVQNLTSNFGTQAIDELTPLLNLSKTIEKLSGRQLSPGENPGMVASYLRGNAQSKTNYMVFDGMLDAAGNKIGPSLSEAVAPARKHQDNFVKYLWAKRSLERWDQNKNPGMTKEDARFLYDSLDSPEFQMAAQGVYEWNAGVLNYVKGLVPDLAPSIENILKNSQDYVPLMREMTDSNPKLAGKGSGGNALFQMKGSGRRVKDIMPQMIANAERLVSMAHKRKVLDVIAQLEDIPGIGSVLEKVPQDKVPISMTISQIESSLKKAGADLSGVNLDQAITFFTPAKFPKGQDPIIPIVKNGKMNWYQVPADLYNSLSGLDLYRLPKAIDLILGAPTRFFRLGTTGLRASFSLFTNPTRDIQTALTQSQSRNPAKLLGNYFTAIANGLDPRRLAGHVPADLDAFKRMGVNLAQPLGGDEAITTRAAKQVFRSTPTRIVAQPINALRELFSIPESFPRIAEMRSIGSEIGWKPGEPLTFDQAVQIGLAGKQATVDFSAAGKAGKVFNQMVPFFNANIQGTRSFARAFKRNPAKATLMGLTSITLPTLALWWANKDKDWYKDMPDREKNMYWNIEAGDQVLQIPRAQEWGGTFATIPEAAADSWYNKDPEGFKKSMGYLLDLATPPIEPVPIKIGHEQWANNIEFFDKPIVPKAEESLPPSEQAGKYTSEVAKWLGEHLPDGKLAGIPINSPRRIDALIRSLGGGLASDITQIGKSSDRERELSDLPVFGRAFRRGGTFGTGSKLVDKFYDALELARQKGASKSTPETADERVYRLQLEDASKALGALRKLQVPAEQKQEIAQLGRDIAARVLRGESPLQPKDGETAEEQQLAENKSDFKVLERYSEGQSLIEKPLSEQEDFVRGLVTAKQQGENINFRLGEAVKNKTIAKTTATRIESGMSFEVIAAAESKDPDEVVKQLSKMMESADTQMSRQLIQIMREKFKNAETKENKSKYLEAMKPYIPEAEYKMRSKVVQ
jgi:diguanylate cyclase (GGDEF)-like protein